jgi:acetylornithine/succinyldiaminopimelate/putrescine aminotransferase
LVATVARTEIAAASQNGSLPILSLEASLALSLGEANRLFGAHLNKYILQVFEVLGLGDLDIVGAEGVEIRLRDGRRLIDFHGGLGVVGLGHNHPRIVAAERTCHDLRVIDCIKLAPHKLQGALAYNLAQFLPDPLKVSFFAVSGSEANEAAMKLCERIQTPKGKSKFICMQGAFHGKTHGPLSVTTAGDFQRGFLMGIPKENLIFLPYGDIGAVEAAIQAERLAGGGNRIIAVIVEPIRGTAVEVPPAGYLTQIAALARQNDILTIFDEVKVGTGRTGRFCAFQHEEVVPDVVTLAKILGGGKRAIGAMVTSQALFDRAYGSKKDCNLHSSSFSGLGETCAVAIETLNVLKDEGLIEQAAATGAYLTAELTKLKHKHPKTILEVRGKGLFQGLRLNFQQDLAAKLVDISDNPLFKTYQTVLIGGVTRELYEQHDILVHFQPGARDIIHFMPPLIVERHHVDRLVGALDTIFTKGIADTTLRFVAKNIKRVFAGA